MRQDSAMRKNSRGIMTTAVGSVKPVTLTDDEDDDDDDDDDDNDDKYANAAG